MSDPLNPLDPCAPGEGPAGDPPPGAGGGQAESREAFPWGADPPPADPTADPSAPRERHDAFTAARKCAFLRALAKTGCILDASRLAGVAPRTIYRHQESDARFAEHCRLALAMCAEPVELTAWQRAVEGVEQEFACGGQVHVRRRYDSGLLRLLLQGSNPKKYGPRPGFKRKRLLRHERRQIEREVRAELEARGFGRPRTLDEMRDSILRKFEAIERLDEPARLAAGWTRSPEGHWIPPGYAPIPGWVPPPAPPDGEEPPHETM